MCVRENKTTSVRGVEEAREAVQVESNLYRRWSPELVRAVRPHLCCLPQREAEALDHEGQAGLKVDSRERGLGAVFCVPMLDVTVGCAKF